MTSTKGNELTLTHTTDIPTFLAQFSKQTLLRLQEQINIRLAEIAAERRWVPLKSMFNTELDELELDCSCVLDFISDDLQCVLVDRIFQPYETSLDNLRATILDDLRGDIPPPRGSTAPRLHRVRVE